MNVPLQVGDMRTAIAIAHLPITHHHPELSDSYITPFIHPTNSVPPLPAI
jgi:hypothetical protein